MVVGTIMSVLHEGEKRGQNLMINFFQKNKNKTKRIINSMQL